MAFVVEGYRTRWLVEEFFKTRKTGCAFESKHLVDEAGGAPLAKFFDLAADLIGAPRPPRAPGWLLSLVMERPMFETLTRDLTAGVDVQQVAAKLDIPHFLGKPFGIDQLYDALERAVGPESGSGDGQP